MPRIPVRVEPYSSPSKQHRHFKCKRDQVLRTLGKAAYINGSHFAIMWVSARGDVETYASDAFQGRLEDWFKRSGIVDEARRLTGKKDPARYKDEEEAEADTSADMSLGADDPFIDTWSSMSRNAHLNTTDDTPQSEMLHTPVSVTDMPMPVNPASMSTPCAPKHPSVLHNIYLRDERARTEFYELRFSQLQQVMCKMVAKAWIKVIEPKKQTRCPYNKGEVGRPSWWPADVRHKEPDHLMKPERHALLISILRSGNVCIARLQLATAEVVALIKAGKVSLLMDIYCLAREEERLREQGADMDTPVTIGVSTTRGWDMANGCASLNTDTEMHMSPERVPESPDITTSRVKRRALSVADENAHSPLPPWQPKNDSQSYHPVSHMPMSVSPQHPMQRSHSIQEPLHVAGAKGHMAAGHLAQQQRMAMMYNDIGARRAASISVMPTSRPGIPEWDMQRPVGLGISTGPEPQSAPLDGHIWPFAQMPGFATPSAPRWQTTNQMYMPQLPVTTPDASFSSFDSSFASSSGAPVTPSLSMTLQYGLAHGTHMTEQHPRSPMVLSDTTNIVAHKAPAPMPLGGLDEWREH